MSGLSDLINKEFHTANFIKDMDISQLMTYAKKFKGEKLMKRKMRESKRALYEGGLQGAKGGGSGSFH